MIIRNIPRSRDEQVLSWLDAKRRGAKWTDLAAQAGKKWVTVQEACRNVRNADLAESGEPQDVVLAGYW